MESARENFAIFINNIEQNFGEDSRCYEIIDSEANQDKRFKEMLDAIIEHPADQQSWATILETQAANSKNRPG